MRIEVDLVERAPATTSVGGIRILNLESLTMQAVVKFNYAALHVIETGGIHKELHSLILKLMIPLFFCTKGHPVFETRATTCIDKYTQTMRSVCLICL